MALTDAAPTVTDDLTDDLTDLVGDGVDAAADLLIDAAATLASSRRWKLPLTLIVLCVLGGAGYAAWKKRRARHHWHDADVDEAGHGYAEAAREAAS